MKAFGFCIGTSRISMTEVKKEPDQTVVVINSAIRVHDGNPDAVLSAMLNEIDQDGARIVVTGREGENPLNLPYITEAEAVEIAYKQMRANYPECDTILTAGAETFLAYRLSQGGQIVNMISGNKCASGTGEFFLQQLRRMNLTVDEALALADQSAAYTVAGRCSVFCKSDCTHALNKGIAKEQVVAGLCRMMAQKISELLLKCRATNILLIGGTAQNSIMVDYIRQDLSAGQELIIPEESGYFEALGAACRAFDTGAEHTNSLVAPMEQLPESPGQIFGLLPTLSQFESQVSYKSIDKAVPQPGDCCIVGLDAGSTTTKAVLIRESDHALLASVYLRTNGDPVRAARECYQSLAAEAGKEINIRGIGVTGSGRQIAGLHAGTTGIINEIIAHATAAVYFDPEVDTIFEIGGQDAKYTLISHKVPIDYAMNEACSAGTGSFLEESARESMGIDPLAIADLALASTQPPNFHDQCAAFIGTDIHMAIQAGVTQADILAGLVYSVCQNYMNRVKGSRPAGRKIFMQGGVCYNRAVPLAMAALIGRPIIVPPEPGLMGAFGAALEVQNQWRLGLLEPQEFNLDKLAQREAHYGQTFTCAGGKEGCDRKCNIQWIEIDDHRYPFGGACNKYANSTKQLPPDISDLDIVKQRSELIFDTFAARTTGKDGAKRVGISKSLLTNSYYPLFSHFFAALGLSLILGDTMDKEGIARTGATFCHPVELAHGFMSGLLKQKPDYIFLPNILGMQVRNGIEASVTCPLVQGEPYYLRTAFPELQDQPVLSPVLDFSKGYTAMAKTFAAVGQQLGFSKKAALVAYAQAAEQQEACSQAMQALGRKALAELEQQPQDIAVIVFGRSYNALTQDGNMGIPSKFSTRGYRIIPWDCLPFDEENPIPHMFWATGQMMLKAAKQVKNHQQLFAVYITNFSCGPDSFLISDFRGVMEDKPSLTLELDNHTADAGIDTRIEAFLDVVAGYRRLCQTKPETHSKRVANLHSTSKKKHLLVDNAGTPIDLRDSRVRLLIPSMGQLGTRLLAASFRYAGLQTEALPAPGERELAIGRAHSSCKECLPFTLVTGSILQDIEARSSDQQLVYFMANSSGPCRLGQYHVQIQKIIQSMGLDHVAVLPLTSDNGYNGLGTKFQLRAWQSIIITEVLDEVFSAILVLAQDRPTALNTYQQITADIETAIAERPWLGLRSVLREASTKLSHIPLKAPLASAVKVGVLGEIFVRLDPFSRQSIVEKLAERNILTLVAPVTEFVYFCDYLLEQDLYHIKAPFTARMTSRIQSYVKRRWEQDIKTIFARSGLYSKHIINIPAMIDSVKHLISPQYTAGDTLLTLGAALTEIMDRVSGIISIAPFGCMPSRVSEAILQQALQSEKLQLLQRDLLKTVAHQASTLPLLFLESDGRPFPPLVDAKIEHFCLHTQRFHQLLLEHSLNQDKPC